MHCQCHHATAFESSQHSDAWLHCFVEFLTCDNDDNQVVIAAAGGVECIVNAMRQHLNHPDIQVHGCAALYSLAWLDQQQLLLLQPLRVGCCCWGHQWYSRCHGTAFESCRHPVARRLGVAQPIISFITRVNSESSWCCSSATDGAAKLSRQLRCTGGSFKGTIGTSRSTTAVKPLVWI